ncbi:hypothetical protein DFH07DRAFT_144105 [Mycena maculata]|uniref:Uncharacterized protein n=1 Tax=Mycena maculata TaxID=230809 RepID=A0AAD7I0L3_9AGAR|nr:hypothetical protein DFH07DRAFT_144105 [Mycena maculata]
MYLNPFQTENRSRYSWNAVISEASHQMLLDHGNVDHTELFRNFQATKRNLDLTTRAYDDLEIRYQTLQNAFSNLTAAVSDKLTASPTTTATLLPRSTLIELLDREDYPNVPIWTDKEYLAEFNRRKQDKGPVTMQEVKSRRGATRLAQDDENVTFWFVTTADGTPVTGSWGKLARAHARSIWIHLHGKGLAPSTWSEADSQVRSYYAQEMESQFPELRLCEFSSKANRIATLTYSGWRDPYFEKHGNRTTVTKADPAVVDSNAEAVVSGTKREATDSLPQSAPKKRKKKKHTVTAQANGSSVVSPLAPVPLNTNNSASMPNTLAPVSLVATTSASDHSMIDKPPLAATATVINSPVLEVVQPLSSAAPLTISAHAPASASPSVSATSTAVPAMAMLANIGSHGDAAVVPDGSAQSHEGSRVRRLFTLFVSN